MTANATAHCHVLYKDPAISSQFPFSILHSPVHHPQTHTTHNVTHKPALLHAETLMWPLQLWLTGPGNAQSLCHLLWSVSETTVTQLSGSALCSHAGPPARDSQGFENTRLRRRLYLPQYHRPSVPPYHRIRTLLNPSSDHIASSHRPDSLPYPSTDLVARFL